MDEEIETIKNGLDNGAININAVVEKLGIKDKLRNADDDKNAAMVKELNSMFGSPADVLAAVKAMKAENESVSKVAVENAVVQAFGAAKIKNARGEEVVNLSYTRAMELCKDKNGAELKTAVENAAKDPMIMHFRSEQADNNSQINVVSGGKTTNASNDVETW